MLTESARMSSAAEARFRIQAPNSKPRAVKVVALDRAGETVVQRLAGLDWTSATFLVARVPATEQGYAADGWLAGLDGGTRSLVQEVETADLIVMVAGPGGHAEVAAVVGEACSLERVNTVSLVVGGRTATEQELSKTLAQVRPWSLMVVLADADDYIDTMLTALRA